MNVKPLVLEAVVLAAGAGVRFGGSKLLAPWRDGVLIEAALASAFAAPVRRIALAVGADGERVAGVAQAFAARQADPGRLIIATTPDWPLGMSAALKRGVAGVAPDVDAVFVFLGDMPSIPTSVPIALAEAFKGEVDAAIPVIDGKMGHPALIGAALFSAIAQLDGDRGARRLLEALGPRLARVPTRDGGVLLDIDTRAALAEAESAVDPARRAS